MNKLIQKKVSIIIPNYNKELYLDDCFLSIFKQSYKNIEIIIVDDCSTDNSREIIKKWSRKYSNIKKYFLKTNLGVSNARNYGVSVSTGELITFLDSDDCYINPDKIKNEVSLIKHYNDIAFSQWAVIDEAGNIIKPQRFIFNPYSRISAISKILSVHEPQHKQLRGYLFTRKLFDIVGGYDTNSNYLEDFDFQCRLALKGKFKYTRKIGEGYRKVSNGLSSNNKKDFWKIVDEIQNKYYKCLNRKQRIFFDRIINNSGFKPNNKKFHNKKILPSNRTLFISDYGLDEPNSVRDILKAIIKENPFCYKNCFVMINSPSLFRAFETQIINGVTHFISRKYGNGKSYLFDNKISIFNRAYVFIILIFNRLGFNFAKYYLKQQAKYLIKKYKLNNVVLLTYNVDPYLVDYLNRAKVTTSVFLYDTILNRPFSNRKENYKIEHFVIPRVNCYFVPSFFYDRYRKAYNFVNLHSYNLPLLINEKDVIKAISNSDICKNKIAYFGQLSNFRNISEISNLMDCIKVKLTVYSSDYISSSFYRHDPVMDADFYNELASSNVLVVFDNNEPYNFYLPSKVYSYVSFTKPILCIGLNRHSAVIDFFKEYPFFYYYVLGNDTSDLKSFINKYSNSVYNFNTEIYKTFLEYLPSTSCNNIRNYIFDFKGGK